MNDEFFIDNSSFSIAKAIIQNSKLNIQNYLMNSNSRYLGSVQHSSLTMSSNLSIS